MKENKGGRPANPTPKWDVDRKVWVVRITKVKNGPQVPYDLPGIRESQKEKATEIAKLLSDKVRRGEVVRPGEGETFGIWTERWMGDRAARGLSSVADDRGRMRKHVIPIIGMHPMATITRDQIECLVEDLDRKIDLDDDDEEAIGWKTAFNIWGLVTKAFDDAVNAKKRDLRARPDNPCTGIKGPERGKRKAKQYIFPDEFLKLMAAGDEVVPLRYKVLYAVAVYTFMRAGELEALDWASDVDLEHNIIHVTKSIDRRTGKPKSTKTGETRRIPIDPNLRPLLQAIHDARKDQLPADQEAVTGPVLWLPPDEERAATLRKHLQAAGVKRPELYANDEQRKNLTFHDLRATGITWSAVRGDDPLRIKQRAGHSGFATTEGYIREAENLGRDFGDPFPPLPPGLSEGGFSFGSRFQSEKTIKTSGKLRPQRELKAQQYARSRRKASRSLCLGGRATASTWSLTPCDLDCSGLARTDRPWRSRKPWSPFYGPTGAGKPGSSRGCSEHSWRALEGTVSACDNWQRLRRFDEVERTAKLRPPRVNHAEAQQRVSEARDRSHDAHR
jgi:integrase